MERRVEARQLDCVKRVAVALETAYMLQNMHLPLKAKYRPPVGANGQWGCGGDYSGKSQQKQAKTAKTKDKQVIRTLRVNGGTGKSRME